MGFRIIVKRGERVIEELGERPIRILPDLNTAAVVYRKAVYPLRAERSQRLDPDQIVYIDLDDAPTDKDDTSFPNSGAIYVFTGNDNFIGLRQVAASSVIQPQCKWSTESTAYGHYLVFDGDTAFFSAVQKSFHSQGLSWLRADECYRPSKDGHTYNWFIRFERDERTPEVFSKQIKASLSQVNGSAGQRRNEMVASQPNSLEAAIRQANDDQLKFERLLEVLRASDASAERLAASKKASEISALERQLAAGRRDLEDAKYKLRKRDEDHSALQKKHDILASQLSAQAEDYSNMQRSQARLVKLLEEERSTNLKQWTASKGNEIAALRGDLRAAHDRATRVEAESEAVRQVLQAEKSVVSQLKQQIEQLTARVQSSESDVSVMQRKLESAEADAQEWKELFVASDQENGRLQEMRSQIDEQIRSVRSASKQRFDELGTLIHFCLPRLSISDEAIRNIVEEGWTRNSSELWLELKKLNDYQHGKVDVVQFAERVKDDWHEIRKHISDGAQSDRLRIYFEIPAKPTDRKKVEVMWKQDKQKQQRFHERLGVNWSPFLRD